MITYQCTDCNHQQSFQRVSIKVVDGEVRKTGDVCEACGGRCKHVNPKSGAPALHGFDSIGRS